MSTPLDAVPLPEQRNSGSFVSTSVVSPHGQIVVLRVIGEFDLINLDVLADALADALAPRPFHLVVDLAGMTFCSCWGHALLLQGARTAADNGIGYTVTSASHHIDRVWAILWPRAEIPTRFPTIAAGMLHALARTVDRRDLPGQVAAAGSTTQPVGEQAPVL
ncbi:MAG: STAS domain-containing protein [Pseudonocardia sp.]|nr:STAS domain-containing protein [Pseudonocardia sp.]